MSTENFSFAKARVSYDPESESVRAAQGGRGLNPIKNQQGNNKKVLIFLLPYLQKYFVIQNQNSFIRLSENTNYADHNNLIVIN